MFFLEYDIMLMGNAEICKFQVLSGEVKDERNFERLLTNNNLACVGILRGWANLFY